MTHGISEAAYKMIFQLFKTNRTVNEEMVEGCCKAMYASPRVKVTGFEMQYWNDAGKGDEENETTIAIKSEMKDLEVRKKSGLIVD